MPGFVFLVDDELHVGQILGRRLQRAGHRVESARDGLEAFDKIVASPPDLIITDLQMPRCNGIELAERLKADERASGIPVILLTSRGHRAGDAQERLENIVKLVAKPFSSNEIVRLVDELLESDRSGESVPSEAA